MRVRYWLPGLAPMAAITIAGTVYAKRNCGQVVLEHEAVHVAQQAKLGWWRFAWRYVFRPRVRVLLEAEAYLVNLDAGWPLSEVARMLSGPLYLWACSYEEAVAALQACAQSRALLGNGNAGR